MVALPRLYSHRGGGAPARDLDLTTPFGDSIMDTLVFMGIGKCDCHPPPDTRREIVAQSFAHRAIDR